MSKPRGLVKNWSLMTSNQTMVDRVWKMSELPLNITEPEGDFQGQQVNLPQGIYVYIYILYQIMVNSELTDS